jgi:hypothetical protein
MQVPSLVSQMCMSPAGQSVDCTQPTQYMRVVSQTGFGARQSPFDPHPATQRCVLVLHVSPEPQWLASMHSTQSPPTVQCGMPPLHCVSVRQCTHCSTIEQNRPLPQFASPTHSTQTPA